MPQLNALNIFIIFVFIALACLGGLIIYIRYIYSDKIKIRPGAKETIQNEQL